MSGLLPTDSDPELIDEERGLRVVQLEDADTERLLGSLSSETARKLFASLHEEPSTASELADQVNTSLQNVRHHLSNLQDADLVYVADTRYSSKGREMTLRGGYRRTAEIRRRLAVPGRNEGTAVFDRRTERNRHRRGSRRCRLCGRTGGRPHGAGRLSGRPPNGS